MVRMFRNECPHFSPSLLCLVPVALDFEAPNRALLCSLYMKSNVGSGLPAIMNSHCIAGTAGPWALLQRCLSSGILAQPLGSPPKCPALDLVVYAAGLLRARIIWKDEFDGDY